MYNIIVCIDCIVSIKCILLVCTICIFTMCTDCRLTICTNCILIVCISYLVCLLSILFCKIFRLLHDVGRLICVKQESWIEES